jgi:hypothetical protein
MTLAKYQHASVVSISIISIISELSGLVSSEVPLLDLDRRHASMLISLSALNFRCWSDDLSLSVCLPLISAIYSNPGAKSGLPSSTSFFDFLPSLNPWSKSFPR